MAENIRKREEIETQYKWDLTHIYSSDETWQADYDLLPARIGELAALNGRVAEDPKKAIRMYFSVQEQLMPIFEYAFLRKETDNADPKAQGLKDMSIRMMVQAGASGAFLEPELLSLDEETLKELMIRKWKLITHSCAASCVIRPILCPRSRNS